MALRYQGERSGPLPLISCSAKKDFANFSESIGVDIVAVVMNRSTRLVDS